ncbi:similar to Saccharomyces cerevisiae YNL206C RTT106 Histone chaperone, involved in regulation of chromatin structure in both transcribed and silenced chromosomal regions [Maudiozyma barnettii]|uniref:Histone chaperone RTT106 n=1 Tax=Maudiozyma barnettii TaxID=61262 RepID=A0A8H2VE95_9SACH|nr:Rtt106p [Kazachstania barnettii]CAB4253870.1 similar to Saccharomyces cerevisiae YNL206C RTT106 Histone chaperone, involved in regulation of chromatin structure in both transcribed and silenced chromosomal regions [Kazachstania barnettii]CAD1781620.1 similar to Saccharomyces cerevisiae YNL206C RTT106 Histone chaperone, involved in regulation of chromatin structure in both transcribed and silenced chromosomal regions [Kazachstania barnettii]
MVAGFLQEVPAELRSKLERITSILPDSVEIFQELYDFALTKGETLERKKPNINVPENEKIDSSDIIFKLENASILSPLRKKLDFVFHLSPTNKQLMISLLKNGKSEYSIGDLKTNIKMATFLPVPEKQNIVYLFLDCRSPNNPNQQEPILMTLNKMTTLEQFCKMGILPSNEKDFKKCKDYMRKQAILTGFRITDPFSNNNTQGQLNSFHVECHRGTKEGTLYFLPDHILFGFKKPILLFQSTDVASITYSSITRLTFNMTLITNDEQKYEFSMIDQSEYATIDGYVKIKQVTDKSMSEELKAKKLKNSQQSNNDESIIKDAVAEIDNKQGTNLQNLPDDSDDEENDQDFQADSDLSDGSDQDEEEGDDNDDNDEDQAEEVADEEEEEEEEDLDDLEEIQPPAENVSQLNLQLNYSTAENIHTNEDSANNINIGSLEDIIVDVDDGDDDDEDNSGVEYD